MFAFSEFVSTRVCIPAIGLFCSISHTLYMAVTCHRVVLSDIITISF